MKPFFSWEFSHYELQLFIGTHCDRLYHYAKIEDALKAASKYIDEHQNAHYRLLKVLAANPEASKKSKGGCKDAD